MPFDPAPREIAAPAEIRRFQHIADALLRGCAVTHPHQGGLFNGNGGACAMGAILVGLGMARADEGRRSCVTGDEVRFFEPIHAAYDAEYDYSIAVDNDSNGLTREQIAARIVAL